MNQIEPIRFHVATFDAEVRAMPSFPSKIRAHLSTALVQNRSLVILIAFSLLCLAVSMFGLSIDHRTINGELAWAKPCKFSLSLAVYGATLIWFSRYLTRHKRFFLLTCRASLVGTVVELSAIIMQVIRGTSSHFNSSTGFDHCVFAVITLAILPVAFSVLALFVMLWREENLPEVLGLSLKWGVFLTLVGLIPGVLMLLPEGIRDALFSYRHFDGHAVGSTIAGRGLPLIGWNAVAGDLRVAHFMGIHGLQILPFVGLALDRLCVKLSTVQQRQLLWNAGLIYLSFIFLLTWQALHSESVVAPSAGTVAIALVIFASSVLCGACTLWVKRPAGSADMIPATLKIRS
jgi:hypothetical protein